MMGEVLPSTQNERDCAVRNMFSNTIMSFFFQLLVFGIIGQVLQVNRLNAVDVIVNGRDYEEIF